MSDQENTTEEEGSKLYWFFHNLRKKVFGGLWQWAKKHWLLAPIILIAIAYLLFTGRAGIQPIIIFIRRYLFWMLVLLLSSGILYLILRKTNMVFKVMSSILFVAILVLTIFFGKSIHNYISLYFHYNSLDKIEIAQIPTTDFERIQPLNSIRTLIRQEAISETDEATSPHFLRRKDGSYDWTVCVGPSPEYKIQRLSKNMFEIISVAATSPAPNFSGENRHNVNFDIGEFLLFGKKTKNATIKSFNIWQYITYQPSDTRFMQNESGEWIQVVSLIRWKGLFFPRPIFGGVVIIEQEPKSFKRTLSRTFVGDGEWIRPNKIKGISFLRGQNLVPESVSRFTAESFRYQAGFLAPMPGYHEGDIRIPVHAEDHNEMPYVTYFNMKSVDSTYRNTLFHYFGLEPYQENKRGLNTSLFIPADGAAKVYYIGHSTNKDGYIGSSAIAPKIVESRKNYDWTKNHPAESRPFIKEIDGERRFFWLNSVVTKTNKEGDEFIGGTIPDITLTDAKLGKVLWVEANTLGNPSSWEKQIKVEFNSIWGISSLDSIAQPIVNANDNTCNLNRLTTMTSNILTIETEEIQELLAILDEKCFDDEAYQVAYRGLLDFLLRVKTLEYLQAWHSNGLEKLPVILNQIEKISFKDKNSYIVLYKKIQASMAPADLIDSHLEAISIAAERNGVPIIFAE